MHRIVDLQAHVIQLMEAERARAWLDVDQTIQQLKVVFLAVRMGSLTAGQISRELRVGFSTVTGLIDRLADQGLVSRGEDPNDRRATRVVPTDAARALVERLYSYHRAGFLRLLEQVPTETLRLSRSVRHTCDAADPASIGSPAPDVAALSTTAGRGFSSEAPSW
jgi:DNA-binding MarR family transcriptional regulator